MKRFLLCAIAASACVNFLSAQWTRLSSPAINDLYATAFNNERFGFVVGAKGTVLRTNDGGATWTKLPSPDSLDIKSVTIVDSVTVIIGTANASGKSAIYKSITKGNSWHKVLRDDRPFYVTKMPNGNLVAISSHAYLSLDKGDTWRTEQILNSTSDYNEVEFPDNHHGFIGGNVIGDTTNHAEFLRSEDAGQVWYQSYAFAFPNNFAFSSMSAVGPDTLFMFTNYDKRFHPKDSSQLLMLFNFRERHTSGDTIWNFQSKFMNKSFPDIINTCKFYSDSIAYAAGEHGDIYISTSHGKKWKKDFRGRVSINGLYMVNENKGYAVGNGGLILKRDVALLNKTAAESVQVKVYPNPANNSSTVSFTLNRAEKILLQVTDETGTVVYSEQGKNYDAGVYQRLLPVSGFQRGVYHINIIIDGSVRAKTELVVVR